jgi:hypothetical protein
VGSVQSASKVGKMRSWVEDQWIWDLRWRRDIFERLTDLYSSLFLVLEAWSKWLLLCKVGLFGSLSVYSWQGVFLWRWNSITPKCVVNVGLKLAVFSWQLLQNRLPTLHNLWKQGVITDDGASMCVLCGLESESTDHLFGSSNQISHV